MSNAILVVTKSGFGKTTSLGHTSKEELGGEQDIEGLNPEETFLINVKDKPLPFRGWKKKYRPWPNGVIGAAREDGLKPNYLSGTDYTIIGKNLDFVNDSMSTIKNVAIDDFQYLMAEEFMVNALKSGYEKFSKMGKNAYDLINKGLKMRHDINFIILTHSEEDNKGELKMKTIGKMLDEKVTLEGLFTVILYGKATFDPTTKKTKKEFVTNYDGEFPAKSPIGMFESLYIPNDMGYVIKKVNNYYNGDDN